MSGTVPLNDRELAVLGVVGQAFEEIEGAKSITRDAIQHLAGGPCAGSLAHLTRHGLLRRFDERGSTEGPSYEFTDRGREVLGSELRRRRQGSIIVPRRVNGG